jgi:hypothetical protein
VCVCVCVCVCAGVCTGITMTAVAQRKIAELSAASSPAFGKFVSLAEENQRLRSHVRMAALLPLPPRGVPPLQRSRDARTGRCRRCTGLRLGRRRVAVAVAQRWWMAAGAAAVAAPSVSTRRGRRRPRLQLLKGVAVPRGARAAAMRVRVAVAVVRARVPRGPGRAWSRRLPLQRRRRVYVCVGKFRVCFEAPLWVRLRCICVPHSTYNRACCRTLGQLQFFNRRSLPLLLLLCPWIQVKFQGAPLNRGGVRTARGTDDATHTPMRSSTR